MPPHRDPGPGNPPPPADERGRPWVTWALLAIAGWSVAHQATTPSFRGPRDSDREKACYSNMRIIQAAIEAYNIDHQVMIATFDDEARRLLSQPGGSGPAYLPNPVACPGTGYFLRAPLDLFWNRQINGPAGEFVGVNLVGDGQIECTLHGRPD